MKNKTPLTYQGHLNLLADQPQNSAWDYSLYLKEAQKMHLFSEMSSTIIFLLDYASKTYPFMARSTQEVMGHPSEAFLEGGLEYMLNQYKLSDFESLNKDIFPEEVSIISQHRNEQLSHLRFTKSYRFKNPNGKCNTILQRHTLIRTKDNIQPIAIFGFAWDITNQTEAGKIIHQVEKYNAEEGNWSCLLAKQYFPDLDKANLLSKREIEILKWAVEGYGSKQIADKMNISFNTVNTHRRNMLRKTNCQNAMELLRYAIENKLL
jgi:DNA-binding CsgD family transcriptional regulator